MTTSFTPALNRFRRLARDESGSITVESVLWLPIYILFFALIADVSLMFHSQSQATRIVHDANRQVAKGDLTAASQVEAAVRERLNDYSPNATISSAFGATTVQTTVTMPVSDVAALGLMGLLTDGTISVSLIHLRET